VRARRAVLAFLLLPALAAAGSADFKPYPGSTEDPALAAALTEQSLKYGGVKTQVWTSADSFEKVFAYYRRSGPEFVLKRPTRPDSPYEHEVPASMIAGAAAGAPAVPVKEVHIILDGAASLATTRRWLTITHPVFAKTTVDGLMITLGDRRDVTAIELFEKP
jgi:hypothetical protein